MDVNQIQALYFLLENYNYFIEQCSSGRQYQLIIQIDNELVTGDFVRLTSFYSLLIDMKDVNFIPNTIVVPKNNYHYYPNACFKKLVQITNRPSYNKALITEVPTLFLELLISIVKETKFSSKQYYPLMPYIRNPKFLAHPDVNLPILKLTQNSYPVLGI
ncbi:hypothetical protein OO382_002670, partial [Listeria monocytogenes]|nr:hypothetical protein [Listeria monocytogenes]